MTCLIGPKFSWLKLKTKGLFGTASALAPTRSHPRHAVWIKRRAASHVQVQGSNGWKPCADKQQNTMLPVSIPKSK
jgi:hypothetical protein